MSPARRHRAATTRLLPIRGVGGIRAVRVVRAGALATVVAVLAVAALAAVAGTTPLAMAGFTASVNNGTNTVATAQYFTCTAAAAADKGTALFQYPLSEASASTSATDTSGNAATGTYRGAMTTASTPPLACSRDAGGAYVLNGTTSYLTTPTKYVNPTTFSEEVWFKTSTAAGKLIGFGASQTGSSSQYDRHVYISTTGQLVFGTYNGGIQILTSPSAYTDGAWHQMAATMSPTTGMRLYVDGALVASNAAYTAPENYSGYWRIGYDNTNAWSNNGTNYFFNGSLRYAAVYSSVLTAQQVQNHYVAGR